MDPAQYSARLPPFSRSVGKLGLSCNLRWRHRHAKWDLPMQYFITLWQILLIKLHFWLPPGRRLAKSGPSSGWSTWNGIGGAAGIGGSAGRWVDSIKAELLGRHLRFPARQLDIAQSGRDLPIDLRWTEMVMEGPKEKMPPHYVSSPFTLLALGTIIVVLTITATLIAVVSLRAAQLNVPTADEWWPRWA